MSCFNGSQFAYSEVEMIEEVNVSLKEIIGNRTGREYGSFVLLNESYETKGGLGLIYRVHHSYRDTNVLALKCPKNTTYIESMKRELAILSRLRHPFIISVNAISSFTYQDDDIPFFIMDWALGSSLDTWLYNIDSTESKIFKSVSLDNQNRIVINRQLEDSEYASRILDIMLQLVSGLEHAHKHNILHLDIKPGNILVMKVDSEPYLSIKICDFNLGSVSSNDETDQAKGTRGYRSPEQAELKKNTVLLEQTDSWGVGLVILEMLTKYHYSSTIRNLKDEEWFDASLVEDATFKWITEKEDTLKDIWSLITGCLQPNPSERLDMKSIYLSLEQISQSFSHRIGHLKALTEEADSSSTKQKVKALNIEAKFLTIIKSSKFSVTRKFEEALALAKNSDDKVETLEEYGWVLMNYCKNKDAAEVQFRRALEINSYSSSVLYAYGWLKMRRSDNSGAEDLFTRALQVDSSCHIHTLHKYGELLAQTGRVEEATEKFKAALKADEDHVPTLNSYSNLLIKRYSSQESLELAETMLIKATRLDKKSVISHVTYAKLLIFYKHDLVTAEKMLSTAIALKPKGRSLMIKIKQMIDTLNAMKRLSNKPVSYFTSPCTYCSCPYSDGLSRTDDATDHPFYSCRYNEKCSEYSTFSREQYVGDDEKQRVLDTTRQRLEVESPPCIFCKDDYPSGLGRIDEAQTHSYYSCKYNEKCKQRYVGYKKRQEALEEARKRAERATPCIFCSADYPSGLGRKAAAQTHSYYNCKYNEKCRQKYVGDDEKQKALEEARKRVEKGKLTAGGGSSSSSWSSRKR